MHYGPSGPGEGSGQSADGPGLKGKLANLSSPSMKIGISVVAGFILGWIFRGFLKTMAFVALALFALLAALSYFGILNVDMTKAKAEYTTAIQWATDQFWKLKDVLVAHTFRRRPAGRSGRSWVLSGDDRGPGCLSLPC